ncbi:lamin tail domain-containing protein [Halobaculum marinum]|uniref:Lamin tail domain-containing protein n=1 Tax=Halobaculum marinum TaxID=3031996 RepID=A0ABD5WU66_9EURY|nr:lamin tail domain-containing protein [Halobaculum sp. DT55]
MYGARGHALLVVVIVVLAGCLGGATPVADPTSGTDATTGQVDTAAATATTVEGGLQVHFINVGQSVATLVVGPTGETMLIDSGHFTDDGEYVLAYLQRLGVKRIDYFVVSHADADHIGGNAAVIEYFETEGDGVGAVYDPGIASGTRTYEEYLDAVVAYDVTLYETREGDQIPFDGVAVSVLGPPDPYLENEDRNENSIVLLVSYGATSFLFTGDAEDDEEAYVVAEYGAALRTTVMKAGHHGSASSTGDALLDAAAPAVVVVSSAYDSQYGHPSDETLDRLAARSVTTFWTATHGHVVLASDGQTVTVATQRGAPTDPDRLRDAPAIDLGDTTPTTVRYTVDADGAATAQVTPSGTPTATATDGGTESSTAAPSGSSSLALVEIHADAAGNDHDNLNDEYLVFENTGDDPLDLSGWTVSDEADHTYTVPAGTTLAAGARVTLYTGSGTDTDSTLYWGSGAAVWNNGGDTVIVRDAQGDEVLREEYR